MLTEQSTTGAGQAAGIDHSHSDPQLSDLLQTLKTSLADYIQSEAARAGITFHDL